MEKKKVLTIAGSDSGGGAGIQADLKTMEAHGVFGMSVITAITAQNTKTVLGVEGVSPGMVALQLQAVAEDLKPDAVKLGMLYDKGIMQVIAEWLEKEKPETVVLDPVMITTSGEPLLKHDAMETLKEKLFSRADLITPNLPEARFLTGDKIESDEEMEQAAKKLFEAYGCCVLIKGGHGKSADDLFYADEHKIWFRGKRIDTKNNHGTGCTLSSAIASNRARGLTWEDAIREAKAYVTGAMNPGIPVGGGCGPLHHGWKNYVNQ